MSGGLQAILRTLLVNEYGSLKIRLARRFGSMDFASEVVHELYLRLEAVDNSTPLRNPMGYLFRMALNIAVDSRKADIRANRPLTGVEIDALRARDVDLLDPARVAEGRWDIETLSHALLELTPRQRGIFLAARLEEVSHHVLAKRFGISERTVERELKSAFDHCRKRIGLVPDETRPRPHRTANIPTAPSAESEEGYTQ